jgi:hypothetical protein
MAAPVGRRSPRADADGWMDRRGAPGADPECLARVLAALADPIRLRIVGLLARQELTGVEVVAALGVSQALTCTASSWWRSVGSSGAGVRDRPSTGSSIANC